MRVGNSEIEYNFGSVHINKIPMFCLCRGQQRQKRPDKSELFTNCFLIFLFMGCATVTYFSGMEHCTYKAQLFEARTQLIQGDLQSLHRP